MTPENSAMSIVFLEIRCCADGHFCFVGVLDVRMMVSVAVLIIKFVFGCVSIFCDHIIQDSFQFLFLTSWLICFVRLACVEMDVSNDGE